MQVRRTPSPDTQQAPHYHAKLSSVTSTILATFAGIFRGSEGPALLSECAIAGAFRGVLGASTIHQQQWLLGSAESTYHGFAKKKGFKPEVMVVSGSTKAYWLGNRSAKKLLVYFHGMC